MNFTYYTYLVGWRSFDRWYYGYRHSAAPDPDDDLWKNYFTSSKYVAEFRSEHGEPDVIRVCRYFTSKEDALEYEDRFLQRVSAIRSPRWINRNRVGRKFFAPPVSHETRLKMAEARRRNGNVRKKPFSEFELQNARDQLKIVNQNGLRAPWTEERKRKLAKSLEGSKRRTGLTNTRQQNHSIAEKAKQRSLILSSCIYCHKEMNLIGFAMHHKYCKGVIPPSYPLDPQIHS